jgi:hypothetical protein
MTTGFAHALDRLPIVVAQRLRLIDGIHSLVSATVDWS